MAGNIVANKNDTLSTEIKPGGGMKSVLFVLFFAGSPAVIVAQNIVTGDNYATTAERFRIKGDPDSAMYYLKKAAEFYQQSGEIERLVNTYNQVGIIYTRQDKYDSARKYLEAARDFLPTMPEGNTLPAATTFISLGVLYAAEKDYDLSLQQHFKSLAIRQALLGNVHADIATNYGNIGNVYLRKIQADSAVYFNRQALEIRDKLFGENSVEIIESYNGLANAYKARKEYATALSFYEKALANKILQRGAAHKDVARFYTNVSDVYFLMGKNEKGTHYKKLSLEATKE
jgi:tetratricopeptide (TPR) repeat protein